MKVTRRFKAVIYSGWNVGWFLLSAIWFIEGAPARGDLDGYLRRSLIIYLASAGCMNLAFWSGFRESDKRNLEKQDALAKKGNPPSA
jgi:hypothetical protein